MRHHSTFLDGALASRDPLEQPHAFLESLPGLDVDQIRSRESVLCDHHGLSRALDLGEQSRGLPLEGRHQFSPHEVILEWHSSKAQPAVPRGLWLLGAMTFGVMVGTVRSEQGLGMLRRLPTFLSLLLLALLMAHELDAVAQSEWRLLPGLSLLEDGPGRRAFIALHVPLLMALTWAMFLSSEVVRRRTQLGLGAFMAVHVGLHATLEVPGVSSFPESLSRAFILGAGLVGADLLMLDVWRTRR